MICWTENSAPLLLSPGPLPSQRCSVSPFQDGSPPWVALVGGWSSPAPSSSPPNLRLDCALKFARPTPAAQAASHAKGLEKPKTDYRGGQGGGFFQVESNIDIDLFKTLLFLLSGFIL